MKAIDLLNEIVFTTSRSSGPGGQNVNKVNSKVTLQLDITNSQVLTASQKQLINEKLSSRITSDGILVIQAQETRSQSGNKEIALEKLDALLQKAFQRKKVRRATKPSKAAKQQRLKKKKIVSEKKKWRKPPGD